MAESLLEAQARTATREVRILRRALERLPGPVRGDTGDRGQLREIEIEAVTADLARAGVLR